MVRETRGRKKGEYRVKNRERRSDEGDKKNKGE